MGNVRGVATPTLLGLEPERGPIEHEFVRLSFEFRLAVAGRAKALFIPADLLELRVRDRLNIREIADDGSFSGSWAVFRITDLVTARDAPLVLRPGWAMASIEGPTSSKVESLPS